MAGGLIDAIRNPWARGLDRAQRRRISRAIRQGTAVERPEDAPHAVKAAQQVQRVNRTFRRPLWIALDVVVVLTFLAFVVGGVIQGEWLTVVPAFAVVSLMLATHLLIAPRLFNRARRAEEANRRIMELHRLDDV
jgi:hypothetical protein